MSLIDKLFGSFSDKELKRIRPIADAVVADMFASISTNAHVQFFLVATLILILGTFMEPGSIILLMTPILLPVVAACGMDPVHFGVIMVVNLAIGFLTPPVGVNLFVASGVSGENIIRIAKAALPMIGLMILVLLVITYFPQVPLCLVGN